MNSLRAIRIFHIYKGTREPTAKRRPIVPTVGGTNDITSSYYANSLSTISKADKRTLFGCTVAVIDIDVAATDIGPTIPVAAANTNTNTDTSTELIVVTAFHMGIITILKKDFPKKVSLHNTKKLNGWRVQCAPKRLLKLFGKYKHKKR